MTDRHWHPRGAPIPPHKVHEPSRVRERVEWERCRDCESARRIKITLYADKWECQRMGMVVSGDYVPGWCPVE